MGPAAQQHIDALFEQLFQEHQRPILNYIYRLVSDPGRAEELTQDTFVRAYRALRRLPSDANHRAWLYRIATNTTYDYLRRRRLVQWLPLLGKDSTSVSEDSPEASTVEQDLVWRCLDELSDNCRISLILFSVEGYSIREIASMLGKSEGAIKTRICRARERFRQVYQEVA
jgi:RNA polymerase sigma-70 factor (ECF subfamily)